MPLFKDYRGTQSSASDCCCNLWHSRPSDNSSEQERGEMAKLTVALIVALGASTLVWAGPNEDVQCAAIFFLVSKSMEANGQTARLPEVKELYMKAFVSAYQTYGSETQDQV